MNAVATATPYADRAARWSAIALGFSIPISVAVDGLLMVAVLACWLASGSYREKIEAIARNPVALAALLLYAMLIIGAAYGERFPGDTSRFLAKYADLLFVPLFVALFRGADARRAGIYALAGALLATVLLSFALRAGMPRPDWLVDDKFFHVPFKHKLTHAVLVAFAAFVFFQLALAARARAVRAGWAIASLLSVINLAFVVPGGTGYVVAGALVLYTGYALWRYRGLAAMIVVGTLSAALVYQASDLARGRVDRAIREYSTWSAANSPGSGEPGYTGVRESSIGLRLAFYRVTVGIIRDHPLIGVGTGGFPKAYADKTRGTGLERSNNPHNEYLLIAAQLGLVGLLALVSLFYFHWRLAPRLATPLETHLARGLLLTIAVGCLFNSLLLDHTEGLLFAWMTGLLYGGLDRGPGARA